MPNPLYRQNVISIADLTTPQLELLLNTALKLKAEPRSDLLEGKLIGSCFFEPSTRTRLSFETAVQRLGGKVIGFADGANTSAKKRRNAGGHGAHYFQLHRCDYPAPSQRRRRTRVGRVFRRAGD